MKTELDRHNQPITHRAMAPSRQEILAASAGWVAVTLNVMAWELAISINAAGRRTGSHLHLHSAGLPWGQFWVKKQRPEKNFKTSSSAWLDLSHSQPALPSKQAWR